MIQKEKHSKKKDVEKKTENKNKTRGNFPWGKKYIIQIQRIALQKP